jgi:hypothetical protein
MNLKNKKLVIMSDQINEFDQVFKDRLSEQAVTPPPAVWENIQATRSFGHVVANRISTNWRIFGTLLMLLLAGGSSIILFGEEESSETYTDYTIHTFYQDGTQYAVSTNTYEATNEFKEENTHLVSPTNTYYQGLSQVVTKKEDENTNHIPDFELLASIESAGFVRPQLSNERLSAYIENLDGWESARPKSFVRYYNMDPIQANFVHKDALIQNPQRSIIDYEYVLPHVERKSFKERSTILLSFTPQSIRKIMRAEYNLSSSFLEQRAKTEQTRLAYTFGAQLHYELKNHKFLETGLNYTQIYEEMSYNGEKRFSNQYNFLEVPFLIGYEDRNSKWGWEVKAGLGIQIHNGYKGYILKRIDEFGATDADIQFRMSKDAVRNIIENNHILHNNQARHEVLNLENKEENPYKTAGVINMHIASGITYYHSIKTTFVLTPYYRRSINSITKQEARFTEQISYMGVSFGARVKF